ncbi:MAG: hypothetical protein C4320_01190 [Armatimonadota bacterium]
MIALAAMFVLAPLARPDFESLFDEASKLYDFGNPRAALSKIAQIKAQYPNEYKGVRLYHIEVTLAANEQQGRVFMKSLIDGAFATDPTQLAGIAPAVEHLKKVQPATWQLALSAAKKAARLAPKSAEAQEAIGICYIGLGQKPLARQAFTSAIAKAKRDPKPDMVWIEWPPQKG